MNSFELLKALSDVDEKYIDECLDEKITDEICAKNRRRRLVKRSCTALVSCAAVLCIAVGLNNLNKQDNIRMSDKQNIAIQQDTAALDKTQENSDDISSENKSSKTQTTSGKNVPENDNAVLNNATETNEASEEKNDLSAQQQLGTAEPDGTDENNPDESKSDTADSKREPTMSSVEQLGKPDSKTSDEGNAAAPNVKKTVALADGSSALLLGKASKADCCDKLTNLSTDDIEVFKTDSEYADFVVKLDGEYYFALADKENYEDNSNDTQ